MRLPKIALLVSLLASLPVSLLLPLSITSNSTPVAQAQNLEPRKAEAGRFLQQGVQQYRRSQYQEAIESWQQALAIYRATSDLNGQANALMKLGIAYDSLSQYQKEIEYFQQALPILQQVGDRNSQSDTLGMLGAAYHNLSQYQRAIESYQQALLIYQQVGDRNGQASALDNLGTAYRSLSQYQRAIEYHQQALLIYQQVGDRNGQASTLGNLGVAYGSLSQYQRAIEYFQQALAIYRATSDRNGQANALNNLGTAYRNLSQYQRAIEYYQQALPIYQQVGDRDGEAKALNNLGTAYRNLSQYQRAIEYYQQALPIYQQVGDRNGQAIALINLGTAYSSLSRYQRAIEYYQQALLILQQVGDRNSQAIALINLGTAYSSLSQYQRAIEYCQQALLILQQVGDRDGEAKALDNLGTAYSSLLQYQRAIEYHQQALLILQQVGDRNGQANALDNLGTAYSSLSQYQRAIEYYQQALPIYQQVGDRNGQANTLGNLGTAYRNLSQYQRAIEYHQQALLILQEVGDRNGQASTLGNLGTAYSSLSQYQRAIEYYQQALPIYQQVGDRDGEASTLNNLGVMFFESGNISTAEKNLVAAIKVWESLRVSLTNDNKVSIFEKQARSYRTLQKVLIAQNKVVPALEIAERGRARAFVELLSQRLGSQQPASQLQEAIKAPSVQQIQQIAKAQNATLVQYSIIYDDFSVQGKQQPRESTLYIWVIQPNGKISFRPVDLKPLWQQHDSSLTSLIEGHQEFLAVRSRQGLTFNPPTLPAPPQPDLPTLHQLLIEPIADLLPQDPDAHVIFIPQGPLFQVPFPALQDAKGDYLIQKHTILTAPSIQVLALTRQQRERLASQQKSNSGEALVLGNPTMPSVSLSPGEPKQPLSPLPGAEVEAKAIAALLNTKAITGAQGTETAIVEKMPQARLIHLATHGLLDDIQGLGSAIALAPEGNEESNDGLLTAAEILNMKLQAELVVLSACNTGQGRITGDGVIGLSRSLISAGVPSVLVSLWAVPDAPTAELMTAFYKNLQKHSDKAQALRQAMLSTMKTHPQPRDWAAFTLIGEAE